MSSDSGNTGRNDASGFFNVGAPLNAVRAGYIRRPADDLLIEAVAAGRYAHVIAPNRSGKSSLIASAAASIENRGARVAVLDLAQITMRDAGNDAGRWYYNVAYRLLRQLRIRMDLQDWWQDKSMLSNRQRLLEFYTEIILGNITDRIVVFIDSIQTVETMPFGDQLLASVRAAFNARSTDPEFMRLTFVLAGECDPAELIDEAELSPFNITQAIPLEDFTRADLALFAPELNVGAEIAGQVLDRVFYWTRGQPYLTQKLCRAISRAGLVENAEEFVDQLVTQQFAGGAALKNEPHMSHIHQRIVADPAHREGLLNLYGRLRKGVTVVTDLGSPLQRKLIATGLIEVDEFGALSVRNRLYEMVFTARWANENLPAQWRAPAIAAIVILLMLSIPFWYTQLLPKPYVRVLTSPETSLDVARTTWLNLRSFPGHSAAADSVFRQFLEEQARLAATPVEIRAIADAATRLAPDRQLARALVSDFWDRQALAAIGAEQREQALLSTIRAFELSTRERRNRAAMLIAADLPLLVGTLRPAESGVLGFDPVNQVISAIEGAAVTQWSMDARGLNAQGSWQMTALDVAPLVRRVAVDTPGSVRSVGLTLYISHQRFTDLSIKLIAPSGRSVQVALDRERTSSGETLRVPAGQLSALVGEELSGTWSLSIRDQSRGFGGQLVGWNLKLNSQGLVEDFQRGLNIPDPAEVPAEDIWVADDNRFAAASTAGSESLRIWDVAFAKPLGTVSVANNEQIVGVTDDGKRLVTATGQVVNTWVIATGLLERSTDVQSNLVSLTPSGMQLLALDYADGQTRARLFDLSDGRQVGALSAAASPALYAASSDGSTLAFADADRSVRVWRMGQEERLAQFDLPMQPRRILLSPDGSKLGVVYQGSGVALYDADAGQLPVFESFGEGDWQFVFSPSGAFTVSGHGGVGYQVRSTADGRLQGPLMGEHAASGTGVLRFSASEELLLTPAADQGLRVWRVPPRVERVIDDGHPVWPPALDMPVMASSDAALLVTTDRAGHVHLLDAGADVSTLDEAAEEISYIGHDAPVRRLAISQAGGLAASVGDDDRLRFWDLDSGLPTSRHIEVSSAAIRAMAFSPAGERLGLLLGSQLIIVDVDAATIAAEIDFLEPQSDFVFVTESRVFSAGSGGNLLSVTESAAGGWNTVQVMSGADAVVRMAVSSDGRQLAIADTNRRVRVIDLATSQILPREVELPSPVADLEFAPVGSRLLVRSQRWMHELSVLPAGLSWSDALFLPRVPVGARPAFDPSARDSFYLPVVVDGRVRLDRFRFRDASREGLFGSREQLLNDWRRRFGLLE